MAELDAKFKNDDKMNEFELSEESLRGISSLQEEADFWSKVSDSAEDQRVGIRADYYKGKFDLLASKMEAPPK